MLECKLTGDANGALNIGNFEKIDDVIKALGTAFPNKNNIHELSGQLSRIYQMQDETVIQYANRVKKIMMQIKEIKAFELQNNEASIAAYNASLQQDVKRYFRSGLKFEIRMEVKEDPDLEIMIKKAITVESELNKRQPLQTINTTQYMQEAYPIMGQGKYICCQICQDVSHEALFCNSAACVYCKNKDHFSNSCKEVQNKIRLICRYCSAPGHSIGYCMLNKNQANYCQYCQELNHEVSQCPFIREYEMCWRCNKSGHNPNFCGKKNIKSEYCENCGMFGHDTESCDEDFCRKCKLSERKCKCYKVSNEKGKKCTFCDDNTHENTECEQVKLLVMQNKNKQQIQCQACDGFGHIAKNCYKMKNFQKSQQGNYENYSNINNYNRNKNYGNSAFNNQYRQNFNNRGNSSNVGMRKTCEYCKIPGHVIQECRKLQAIQNYSQNNARKQCSFCKNTGHLIDTYTKLKALERSIDQFCDSCKMIGHTSDNCFRQANGQQNYKNDSGNGETLPGKSAQVE